MFNLDVPITPVDPSLIDPAYATRHEWVESHSGSEPTHSSAPILIGRVINQKLFSHPLPDISISTTIDLELGQNGFDVDVDRLKGLVVYRNMPDRLAQFGEAITKIAAHEHGAYPGARYSSIGITVDQTPVVPGQTQRIPHFHRDISFGEPEWANIYVVSDVTPTEFVAGVEGFLGSDLPDESELEVITGKPYDIMGANITAFHRSGSTPAGGPRTFLRVGYRYDLSSEA